MEVVAPWPPGEVKRTWTKVDGGRRQIVELVKTTMEPEGAADEQGRCKWNSSPRQNSQRW